MTPDLPRALRGHNEAVAITNLNDFQVRDPRGASTFESMYANTGDKFLNGTGRETFEAVKLMQSIQKQGYTPSNGARYPGQRLGQSLQADRTARSNRTSVSKSRSPMSAGGIRTSMKSARKPARASSPIC